MSSQDAKPQLNPPHLELNEDYEEWQQLVDQVVDQSEEVLDKINVANIPVEMFKVLRIHTTGGRKYVFPIEEWIGQGTDIQLIEETINRWYNKNFKIVLSSDFVVNLDKLQKTVQPETNTLLKGLK